MKGLVAMATWPFVQPVDVTDADWQIPFVTYVLNTYARKRNRVPALRGGDIREFAICSTALQRGRPVR